MRDPGACAQRPTLGRRAFEYPFPAPAQLHVKAFFELKDDAHALFEVCRSLGLAGTLRQDKRGEGAMPFGARVKINALRLFAAGSCAFFGVLYIAAATFFLPALSGEPIWFRLLFGLAAGMPYPILALLLVWDMIESLPFVELCVMVGFGIGLTVVLGVISKQLAMYLMLAFLMVLFFAAAYAALKCCTWPATKRSRVAMLCKCRYATALLSPEML